jgi:hypothetical protein
MRPETRQSESSDPVQAGDRPRTRAEFDVFIADRWSTSRSRAPGVMEIPNTVDEDALEPGATNELLRRGELPSSRKVQLSIPK